MKFEDLFARASVADLQMLLSPPSLKLINLLEGKSLSIATLREIIIGLYTYEGMLLNSQSRELLFDLMRPDETGRLLKLLGEDTTNNPYQTLKSLRFRQLRQKEILFDFFALVLPEIEEVQQPPSQKIVIPSYSLFAHQRDAVLRVKEKLAIIPFRVLLHMPTGSGKTRTAMNIIAEHLRTKEPGLVIWLAHSEELCEQAAEEFDIAWSSLGNRPVSIYRFWSHHSINLDDIKDGVVVAGLSKTFSTTMREGQFISELGRRTSLVIIDEAHSAIAPTYKFILDTLTVFRRDTALLGLTATPGRTWADIHIDKTLAEFFAYQKVTLRVEGYRNPVDYLVDEQYLARVEYHPLYYEHGEDLAPADLEKIHKALDIPENILQQLADDEVRNLLIIQKIEDLVKRHLRLIVFAATVEHADLLASVLRSRGLDARSVTSHTTLSERKKIIEAFKDDSDRVRIVCNYGVLTTGFDAPRTSAAIIARPTKSLVLYSQMVGRAIRGPQAGGNEWAEVVTVVDYNLPSFGSVAEAFNNWEDIWE